MVNSSQHTTENGRFQTGAPCCIVWSNGSVAGKIGRYKMKVMPSMPATMSLSLRKRRFEVLFLGRCLVGQTPGVPQMMYLAGN